jgi:hypothetical protein
LEGDSCWPLRSGYFCRFVDGLDRKGGLLPWSFGSVGGHKKPCTPQWIVPAMGDIVQNLFWHFGEYAKRIKYEAVLKYRDGNLSPVERRC